MKPTVVDIPSINDPIKHSPGFAKKELATRKLDIMGWCQASCLYCSSPAGNYLRINRKRFADLAEEQTGKRLYPGKDPEVTLRWEDFEARLDAQLATKPKDGSWGAGETCQFGQLVDNFSPWAVESGLTRRTLEKMLARTAMRFRILTKFDYVGRREWIDFFLAHPGRFVVGLSIGTLDGPWARKVELGTSSPSARLRAHRRLQDEGVFTYGMHCPVFPHVLEGEGVEKLVAAIRPEWCETIWSEPYNDRANWRAVAAGYEEGSDGRLMLESMFSGHGARAAWSQYALELWHRVERALGPVADRHRYLIYQDGLLPTHRERMHGAPGVLFQSDEKKKLPVVGAGQ